jgi:uncharacterized membrane protein
MNDATRMTKWLALAGAAALAACTDPASNNAGMEANSVAEANGAAEVNAVAAGNESTGDPGAGNEVAAPASNAAEPEKAKPDAAADRETYSALGQEPGWALKIAGGRIDYQGNYGEKKISVARPEPKPSANGRRYVTPRLTVDVTYVRCNDAMSGFGFEHQVTVIADGETYKGCGGARKKDWDM